MHKQMWLWTFVAQAILMAGLSSQGLAQTSVQRNPLVERFGDVENQLVAAKAAAARVAWSRGPAKVPRSAVPGGDFLTFDAPGASRGTFPAAVSASGFIAGYYTDANSLAHGFLRAPNGAFTTFEVRGAVNGTFPSGVDDDGAVAGGYYDNVGSGFHSFLRDRTGAITTFDPPVRNVGSQATAISLNGTSTGTYFDENGLKHGFRRQPDGKIITFAAPGATSPYGTSPFSIIGDGRILGIYSNASGTFGFWLTSSGGFIKITGPGGLRGQYDYYNSGPALSINPSNEIAGTYFAPIPGNPFGGNYRVFERFHDGAYITFDAATYPPCCIWSAPSGINSAGTITGSFNDGYQIDHGFWRTAGGKVTTFDVPGAGKGFNQGSVPIGITDSGVIAGLYRDGKSLTHGFLFKPSSPAK
jgi:hypothetical protein